MPCFNLVGVADVRLCVLMCPNGQSIIPHLLGFDRVMSAANLQTPGSLQGDNFLY